PGECGWGFEGWRAGSCLHGSPPREPGLRSKREQPALLGRRVAAVKRGVLYPTCYHCLRRSAIHRRNDFSPAKRGNRALDARATGGLTLTLRVDPCLPSLKAIARCPTARSSNAINLLHARPPGVNEKPGRR